MRFILILSSFLFYLNLSSQDDWDFENKENKNKENDKNSKEDNENKKESDQNNRDNKKDNNKVDNSGNLSPEQVKSILEAMNNQEMNVQDKINKKKIKGIPIKNDKDW